MLFAALVAGQALAYGAPAYDHAPAYDQGYERPCECARVERREEIRLDDSFFVGGGGVGPAFAGASASASASASVRANISVSIAGGWSGGGHGGGKPHGGGYGGKH